jgi:hypothetical protein
MAAHIRAAHEANGTRLVLGEGLSHLQLRGHAVEGVRDERDVLPG